MVTRNNRGRAAARAARSGGSRSNSRIGAAAAARRSGTPSQGRGRGRGGGRGGRGGRGAPSRAASVPRTAEDYEQLRQRLEEMQERLNNAEGANGQLQAEFDDFRMSRAEAGAMDVADDAAEREVIVTDMPPPPSRAPGLAASMRHVKEKEDYRAWTNPANCWRWYITGVKPVATGLNVSRMKLIMHDKAEITTSNLGMLNDVSDVDIREFIAPGDDRFASDRMPTEHLEIFIDAIITLVSKGVHSSVSQGRVDALERGLRRGLDKLRQHCIECRNLVRVPENFSTLVDLANLDINSWGARVFDEATNFVAIYPSPPEIGDFPVVVVPA